MVQAESFILRAHDGGKRKSAADVRLAGVYDDRDAAI